MMTFGQLSPHANDYYSAYRQFRAVQDAKTILNDLKTNENPTPQDLIQLSDLAGGARGLRKEELIRDVVSQSWKIAENMNYGELTATLEALSQSPVQVNSLVDRPLVEKLNDKLYLRDANKIGLIMDRQG